VSGECSLLSSRRVLEVMSSPPVSVEPGARLSEAARVMYSNNVGSVIVLDEDGGLAGILTRRDVLRLVATGAAARDPPVSSVMSTSVVTVADRESLAEALARMRAAGVKHLVVVDSAERPVGVLSMWDVLRELAGECAGDY